MQKIKFVFFFVKSISKLKSTIAFFYQIYVWHGLFEIVWIKHGLEMPLLTKLFFKE